MSSWLSETCTLGFPLPEPMVWQVQAVGSLRQSQGPPYLFPISNESQSCTFCRLMLDNCCFIYFAQFSNYLCRRSNLLPFMAFLARRTSVTFRIHWSINFYSIASIVSGCAKSQMIYRGEIKQHSWLQGAYKSAKRRAGMKSLFHLLRMFSLISLHAWPTPVHLAQILLPTWGYSLGRTKKVSFETNHSLYIF